MGDQKGLPTPFAVALNDSTNDNDCHSFFSLPTDR